MEVYQQNIWDTSLTYGHYNLHNTSLFTSPIGVGYNASFADYCRSQKMLLLAAAPLSMGLLTHRGPPLWHPASDALKKACAQAADICQNHGVDISTLALLVAMSNPNISCTILGMGTVEEVKANRSVALRFHGIQSTENEGILKEVMTDDEAKVWDLLRDSADGPFAALWKTGVHGWNGIEEARTFWKQVDEKRVISWQASAASAAN